MSARGIADATNLIESAWATRRASFSAPPAGARMLIEEARRKLVESASICREIGTQRELGQALHKLGHVEWGLRHLVRARELYEEALSIARAQGEPLAVAHEVRHLGDMHREAGRLEDAEACYEEALLLYRRHAKPPALDFANAIHPLAKLKEDAGLVEEARGLLEEARDLYDAAGVRMGVADCSKRLARLSSTSGHG